MRPAWHTKTGICVVCHKKRLAEQLRQQTSEAEAERDYQSAKQQAHRARVCSIEGCDHVANGTGGRARPAFAKVRHMSATTGPAN